VGIWRLSEKNYIEDSYNGGPSQTNLLNQIYQKIERILNADCKRAIFCFLYYNSEAPGLNRSSQPKCCGPFHILVSAYGRKSSSVYTEWCLKVPRGISIL
jgi:hypothetical protein